MNSVTYVLFLHLTHNFRKKKLNKMFVDTFVNFL